MAGIGFELKKMFNKKGIFYTLRGIAYSALTTVGPMVLIILTILAINFFLNYNSLPYEMRDLISAGILYVFIFSLIITSPFTAVLSRFIADKIYEKDLDAIMPSFYMGVLICSIMSALVGIPFSLYGIWVGNIDPVFMGLLYVMFMMMCFVFVAMSYINILKEYKGVFMAFFIGMIVTFATTFIFVESLKIRFDFSIIIGFNLGYLYIGFRLYTLLKLFLPHQNHGYGEVLGYFSKHKPIFFSTLFYILGMYIHNFVFWNSSLGINVSNTFVIAPSYDLATCFAMFTNISFMVAFVVKIETSFYDKYNDYCHMLIGGNKKDIDISKKMMFSALLENLISVIKLQSLFTFCFILVSFILFPAVGLGGMVASIYPTLAVSYIVVFVSYAFIVILYYFDDGGFAALSTGVFVVCIFAGAMFAKTLRPELYGLGVMIGSLCSFSVSAIRLKYLYAHLDEHIFCRGIIVNTVIRKGKLRGKLS